MQHSFDPYPFVVITMAAAPGESWESFVYDVANDDDLQQLADRDIHPSIVFAALKSLYPVRLGENYMCIPAKKQFFEVFAPFDV